MLKTRIGSLAMVLLLSSCLTDQTGTTTSSPGMAEVGKGASLLRLSRGAQAAGDVNSAINVLRQGIISNPKYTALYIELSEIYLKQGQTKEAIKVLEVGGNNNPDDITIIRKLGNAYLMVEEPEKALVVFDKGLETNKKDALIYSSRGIAYDMLGNKDEAKKAYDTSLQMDNENISAMNNLAMSYILSSRLAEAQNILEKIAFKRTAPAQVRQNLAFVYALQGEGEKAKKVALRDLSEKEVRDNLEFYKKVSGFMITENATPGAPVSTVAAKEVGGLQQQAALPVDQKAPMVAKLPEPSKPALEKVEAIKPAEVSKVEPQAAPKTVEPQVAELKPQAVPKQIVEAAPAPMVLPEALKQTEPKPAEFKPEEKTQAEIKPLPDVQQKVAENTTNQLPTTAAVNPKTADAPTDTEADLKRMFSFFSESSNEKQVPEVPKQVIAGNINNAKAPAEAKQLGDLAPASGVNADVKEAAKPAPVAEAPKDSAAASTNKDVVFNPKDSKLYFINLGKYKNAAEAEKSWAEASKKVGKLKDYKPMTWDNKDGTKKLVVGPFNYPEQYSPITQEMESKKVTYDLFEQNAKAQ